MMQHQKIEKIKSLETPIGITTIFHNKEKIEYIFNSID